MTPKVMLYDEPTSALDPSLVGEVLNIMRQLDDEGMTQIIVTHEMRFARDVADKIIVLDEGESSKRIRPKSFSSPARERTRDFLPAVFYCTQYRSNTVQADSLLVAVIDTSILAGEIRLLRSVGRNCAGEAIPRAERPTSFRTEEPARSSASKLILRGARRQLRRPPVFVQNQWDGLIPGLQRGKYDLALNGLEVTEDRKAQIDFSIPYYATTLQISVRVEENSINSLADLKGKGRHTEIFARAARPRTGADEDSDLRRIDQRLSGPRFRPS